MSVQRPLVVVFSKIPGLTSTVVNKITGINVKDVPLPENGKLSQESLNILKAADILLADPGPVAEHGLTQNMPNLSWMQSTWAGVDSMMRSLDRSKLPDYRLTRFSGQFGQIMGEYVVGYIIVHERRFAKMAEVQKQKLWRPDLFNHYRLLPDLTLGILGMGDIGKGVAKFAKTFGMGVKGLVRNIPESEHRCPHVDDFVLLDELSGLLGGCDYLCSVLPSTPQTIGMLSDDVLAHCKHKKPVFISIGRGDVIDECSIIKALDEGWISHAILDVFPAEPLPTSSALWTHPDVTITPHVSAVSLPAGVTELFCKNYDRFVRRETLLYPVDWQAGY